MSEHLPLHDALDCAPPAMYVLQFQPSLLQLTTRVILSVTYLDCSSLWPRVRDRRREAPLSVRRWLAMILGQMVPSSLVLVAVLKAVHSCECCEGPQMLPSACPRRFWS